MKKKIPVLLTLGLLMCASPSLWGEVDTKFIHVSFEVRPVFLVKSSSSSSGTAAVDFGWVVPSDDSSPGEILEVTIATNTARSYRIYQTAASIQSDEGSTPPEGLVKFKAMPGLAGGRSEVSSYEDLRPGKRLIFSSRPGGGADQFQIHYQLGESGILDAGDYYGRVAIDGELS